MNQKTNFAITIFWILICGPILGGCSAIKSSTYEPTPIFSQSTPQTQKNVPPVTMTMIAMPTLHKAFVITPDDLFSISGLKLLSTPSATTFCEQIPPPRIIDGGDEFSLLKGRFVLCVSISWPLVKTAMDIDAGTLVSVDNKNGDIAMDYAHLGVDGSPSYFVRGLNGAQIDEVTTDTLSYEYCKNLLSQMDNGESGVLNVDKGTIACIMTTEQQIALIRVENIFPLETQSVEFSFSILLNQ